MALSALPCGSVAGRAAKGCGSSGARTAARSADDWATNASSLNRMRAGALGAEATDAARVGRLADDGLAHAGDGSLASKMADHGFDAVDLASLTLSEDESLQRGAIPAPQITALGRADTGLVVPANYYSLLPHPEDPARSEVFTEVMRLRGILDESDTPIDGLELNYESSPGRFRVFIAAEWPNEVAPTLTEVAFPTLTTTVAQKPQRKSLGQLFSECVDSTHNCIVLGCPAEDPAAQERCGLAAFDLVLTCKESHAPVADCLRARGDLDSEGPSVTVAVATAGEIRVLRSTRGVAGG